MYSFSSYYSLILSPLYLSLLSVLGTVSVRITHGFSLLFICLCYLFYVQFQFLLLTDSLSFLSVSVICFRYTFSSNYSRILPPLYLSLFCVQFQFVLLTDTLSSLSVSVICFRYTFSSYYSRILSPLYLSLLSVLCTVSVRITHGFSLLFICLCYLFYVQFQF